jgi:hypothetical protein
LGRKVSLRYRLHDDPQHPFSEAIGVVSSVAGDPGEQELTVLSRRGGATRVAVADVLAAKVFPARGPS